MGKIYCIDKKEGIAPFLDEIISSNNISTWLHFVLVKDADYSIFTGKNADGIYQIKVNKKIDYWEYRVNDFISYIETRDLKGILEIDKDSLAYVKEKCKENTYSDPFLRPYESKVLIHSCPARAWPLIKDDDCLKSWNILMNQGKVQEKNPIGHYLGDPEEFSDYVMLGTGTTCEIVVSSSDKHEINCDENCLYEPGVRLYFDANKIAEDGCLIRDGAHTKVKNQLNLERYLLFAARPENVDDNLKTWTSKAFSEKADKLFYKMIEGEK